MDFLKTASWSLSKWNASAMFFRVVEFIPVRWWLCVPQTVQVDLSYFKSSKFNHITEVIDRVTKEAKIAYFKLEAGFLKGS